jgi:poly-beta-1,6-N-acetyl-D-glucosamine biosynthesis protein PgaD
MRSAWHRQIDWVLTGLLWLAYLYMIRQAFVDIYYLGIDAFDWGVAGSHLPSLIEMSSFLHTLRNYGIVVVTIGATLIVWGLYNQVRFRGRERRSQRQLVTVADLAALYELPAESIAAWQGSRVLVMDHDPDGTIAGVTTEGGEEILPRPRRAVALKEAS